MVSLQDRTDVIGCESMKQKHVFVLLSTTRPANFCYAQPVASDQKLRKEHLSESGKTQSCLLGCDWSHDGQSALLSQGQLALICGRIDFCVGERGVAIESAMRGIERLSRAIY